MVTPRTEPDQTRILNQDPQRIRWLRVAAGLDQQSLARLAGISKTTMWQYEHGGRSATPEILGKIAAVLGCRIVDLMPPEAGAVVRSLPSPDALAEAPEDAA